MNEKSFWQFAADSLKDNSKIVLITVADSYLSSPGKQGFKMFVLPDRTTKGTIGGGIMENQLIDYAVDLLSGNETKLVKRLQHSSKTELENSGLICGGFQSIIFTVLSSKDLSVINSILSNIEKKRNGIFELKQNSFNYYTDSTLKVDYEFNYEGDTNYYYKENIGLVDTAYVIGGGHVGLAVCQVMKFLGFHVIVFDHREDVFTMKQNVYADEKIIIDYKDVKKHINDGNKSYVIIVTPQHMGDKEALGSVIHMNFKYIGMMGSKRKIKTIFNNLAKEGYDKKLFERVHSPIGLEIEAETPNEIAVSIAAEVIKIKHSE